MKQKYTLILGILALGLLVLVLLPSESGFGVKLRAWFQEGDPEYITVLETQTVTAPPRTITEPYTTTQEQVVTVTPGISWGTIDMTGEIGIYEPGGTRAQVQSFFSGKDPGDVGLRELGYMLVMVEQVIVQGTNLDPHSIACSYMIKLDLPDGSTRTLWSTSWRADRFSIQGKSEEFIATRTDPVSARLELLEIAESGGLAYHNDGTEWQFRLKLKATILTPKGTELTALVEKKFTLVSDWCTECGGVLVLADLTPPRSTEEDIIWWGGKVGLLSMGSPSIFGVPLWLIGVLVVIFGYRYYRSKEA